MVPIYRGDKGKLMHIQGYDCYRFYYCTFAPPPPNTFKERCALKKPPPLFTKLGDVQPRRVSRRMVARAETGAADGDAQPYDPEFVVRLDMAADVEIPLDLSGGDLGDLGSDDTLQDQPRTFEAGSKDDPDHFEGENPDYRLYEENEH